MRIISGQAGSVPLHVPPSLTRPTTDRVRESVFAALGDLVPGARVLDLFAGSGSLGLEALSRGALSVDFVEIDPVACKAIEENLKKTKLASGRVHRRDALAFLSSASPSPAKRPYDLIFADPPYARDEEMQGLLHRLLHAETLLAALARGGLLVLESLSGRDIPETPLWKVADIREYGNTRISYLRFRE